MVVISECIKRSKIADAKFKKYVEEDEKSYWKVKLVKTKKKISNIDNQKDWTFDLENVESKKRNSSKF